MCFFDIMCTKFIYLRLPSILSFGIIFKSLLIQYNTVKLNLKGPSDLLRFRDSFDLKKSKDKEKKNFGLNISFGSSNRFGLNVCDLTLLKMCHTDKGMGI